MDIGENFTKTFFECSSRIYLTSKNNLAGRTVRAVYFLSLSSMRKPRHYLPLRPQNSLAQPALKWYTVFRAMLVRNGRWRYATEELREIIRYPPACC
jgi:hypothetical protein